MAYVGAVPTEASRGPEIHYLELVTADGARHGARLVTIGTSWTACSVF